MFPINFALAESTNLRKFRACEACRRLKISCKRDDNIPEAPCRRCAKANRQCVMTFSKRKRQRQTTSRVTKLERKTDALTASILSTSESATATSESRTALGSATSEPGDSQSLHSTEAVTFTPEMQAFQAFLQGDPYAGEVLPTALDADMVEGNLLDAATANRIFDRYKNEMCHHIPVVVFRPEIEAENIRHTKPILFLSIIAVACGILCPDLQAYLLAKVTRILADRILFRGQKSMELIQTLHVIVNHYAPPVTKCRELNFSQLTYTATVMALDLGLGKRSTKSDLAAAFPGRSITCPDLDAVETRRCWLACYYNSANNAMALRRPSLLRWFHYIEESLGILTNSADALPSDNWLCHLVRAQHIAEDVGFQFSMDDPISGVSFRDVKTQYHLKTFERRLEEWRQKAFKDEIDMALIRHTEAIINLYMHEIALHYDHNAEEFVPPCTHGSDVPEPRFEPSKTDFVTPAHIDSLTLCLSSIHAAFDVFLATDTFTLRVLPILDYVRLGYAAVALIKMSGMVMAKGSRFGSIFNVAELKVDHYLDALISALSPLLEGDRSTVAHWFRYMFGRLKGSYAFLMRHNDVSSAGAQRALTVSNSSQGFISGVSKTSRSLSWALQRFDESQVQNAVPATSTHDVEFKLETVDAILFPMEYQDWFSFGIAGDTWTS